VAWGHAHTGYNASKCPGGVATVATVSEEMIVSSSTGQKNDTKSEKGTWAYTQSLSKGAIRGADDAETTTLPRSHVFRSMSCVFDIRWYFPDSGPLGCPKSN
jgi:hypothetical protein